MKKAICFSALLICILSCQTIGKSNVSPGDIVYGALDGMANYKPVKTESNVNSHPEISDSTKTHLMKYKK